MKENYIKENVTLAEKILFQCTPRRKSSWGVIQINYIKYMKGKFGGVMFGIQLIIESILI